ncbi:MAG: glycosyltransferase [Candidatus Kryptoniota bacterium]
MYFDHASSLCPSQSEIINSRNPIVGELYARAQTMIGDGKYDEAKEILMKALVIEPLHPACLNDLAVLHSLGKEPNAAIEVLNCLLETDPENVVAGRNLARLYLQTGKIENALRSYLAVLKITTEDNDTLLAVAKVCISLDRLEDAKFFFNKVLMTSKDAVLKRRVMSQISELENRQCDEKAASMPIKDIMPGSAAGEVLSNCPDAPQQALADTGVTVSNPLVSIILLVYNKLEFSRRCIQSIFANVKYKNYEIVVTDNGSSDGTQEFMTDLVKRFEKIKYVRNQSNLGFVGGNNNGVAAASGKYIILLNNDTIVNEGWLESLVDLAVKTPDCGVVGSKLIYPDGRLQEAGGIIFSDGNGWNYGRWMNPDDPKYNFVREVDYVSGASLMVRRDLWEEIGGFDVRYSPAYYEDTDLCFAIRNLGYRVYYQPRSSVFHYEGVTSGTNLNEGFKKFQVINRPKFAEKWRAELMDQYPNDPRNVEKASSRGTVKRVLITSPSFPMFDRAAGSLYLFNIMKILRRMKFSVTFIAANPVLYESYQPFLRKLGIETYPGDQDAMNCFGYKGSCPKIDYERLFREREFDFALIDFWYQAEYYLPLIKKYSPSTTVIIDTEDVHFVRETREAEVKDDPEMKIRAAVNKRRELAIYRKADSLWVVTDEDKRALAHEIHDVPIDILPLIHELPEANHGFENRQGLLFVGNFNHTPNIDAVQFFVKDVLPKVAKFIPEVILYIVGNDPRNETAKLAGENVKAVGYVEDLSVYYDKCKVVVAPLRYGAGLKGKIVESLSYGVPVVTTSIGAEGTGLQDGEDIMVSDDPDEMAKRIAALYSNKETWERLSENGRIQMQSRWSVEAGQKRLEDILLNRTLETRGSEGKLTSIVILTYNQLEYTKLTIDSIRKYTKVPYEIIVVDNASSDGTVRYLKAQKDIRTIFNRENVGFPAGCNQGMELAKGDYIVLVNNDVIVPNDWLEGLIECAESNASIGVVGPMSNKISGFQMERNVKYKKINQMHEFAASYRRKYRKVWIEAQRVAGFCMLIKRTVLDKIGGLDVAFGMGNCEDDDFCVRSSLAGFKIVIAGDVFIHHFGSRSFGKDGLEKYKEFIKVNEDIFKEKWGVTPLEWWRERKNITKVSSLYVPLNIGEAVPVLSEGTFGGK